MAGAAGDTGPASTENNTERKGKRRIGETSLSPGKARVLKTAKESITVEPVNMETEDDGFSDPKYSKANKAVIRAQKTIEKAAYGIPKSYNGFTAEFKSDKFDELKGKGLLKIYTELKQMCSSISCRVTAKSTLIVTVLNQSQLDMARTRKSICGVPVTLVQDNISLWGRIVGVNPQFSEEELLEVLESQGVEEVKREIYFVRGTDSDGKPAKVQRSSDRVRLRFTENICPEVDLGFEKFQVQLCVSAPLQCLSCYKFNHKKEVCLKRNKPLCRRCGQTGHQMWECDRSPHCVNCKGKHISTDPRCPVFGIWAKHSRERQLRRVMSHIPDVRVEELPPIPAQVVALGEKTSFAQAVGTPASYKVIRKGADGGEIICYLPKEEKPKSKITSKQPQHQKKVSTVTASTSRSCKKTSELKGLIKTLWQLAKPIIESMKETNPGLVQIVNLVESLDLINKVMEFLGEEHKQNQND